MKINRDLESLRKAIELEKEGSVYYKKAASIVKSPVTAGLFEMLAADEMKHIEFLQNYFEKLSEEGKWPDVNTVNLDKDFKLIFKEAVAGMDAALKVSTDEVEAMRHALELENKGRAMYEDLSEKASERVEKEMYAALAAWEKGHEEYIENFANYFQENGLFTEE